MHHIKEVFSRHRFETIYWNIVLSDPTVRLDDSADRFAHARDFVNDLNASFSRTIHPGCHLVVDETMIKFRGEHLSIQLMPKKPIPVGFKAFTLATLRGYILNETLYEGKTTSKSDAGLTYRVVRDLLRPYEKGHHVVAMDSYYTSATLLVDLFSVGVLVVGSVVPFLRT